MEAGNIRRQRWQSIASAGECHSEHKREAEIHLCKESGLMFLLYPNTVLFLFEAFLEDYWGGGGGGAFPLHIPQILTDSGTYPLRCSNNVTIAHRIWKLFGDNFKIWTRFSWMFIKWCEIVYLWEKVFWRLGKSESIIQSQIFETR